MYVIQSLTDDVVTLIVREIALIIRWHRCAHTFTGKKQFLLMTLALILLTWRIWWAPNNASRWQMGFNTAFKG